MRRVGKRFATDTVVSLWRSGYLSQFCQHLGLGARNVPDMTAKADKCDPWAQRQAQFRPFCKVTTACGAKWSCDGQGNLQLIEPNDIEDHVMVAELLEYLGIACRVFRLDIQEQRGVIADVLTAFLKNGRSLPTRNLIRAHEAEAGERRVLSYTEVEDCHKSKNPKSAQCGDCTCVVRCPLEYIADSFQNSGGIGHGSIITRRATARGVPDLLHRLCCADDSGGRDRGHRPGPAAVRLGKTGGVAG